MSNTTFDDLFNSILDSQNNVVYRIANEIGEAVNGISRVSADQHDLSKREGLMEAYNIVLSFLKK